MLQWIKTSGVGMEWVCILHLRSTWISGGRVWNVRDCMLCPLPSWQSYIKALTFSEMDFGDGTFGRSLRSDDLTRVGTLSEETLESFLFSLSPSPFFPCSLHTCTQRSQVSTQWDGSCLKAKQRGLRTRSASTFIPDFPVSTAVRNKLVSFYNHRVYGILLWHPKLMKKEVIFIKCQLYVKYWASFNLRKKPGGKSISIFSFPMRNGKLASHSCKLGQILYCLIPKGLCQSILSPTAPTHYPPPRLASDLLKNPW